MDKSWQHDKDVFSGSIGHTSVGTIGTIFPVEWLPWPAKLKVRFRLSDGQGVNGELFDEYHRELIGEALKVVLKPRVPGLLIEYLLLAELKAVPPLSFVVDRPLRGGKKVTALMRNNDQFAELCLLYQHVARKVGFLGEPAYFDEHSVRLAVCGKSAEDAEQNWNHVARELKKLISAKR